MKGKCKGCTYNCCELESVPITLDEYDKYSKLTDKIYLKDNAAWLDSPCPFFKDGCTIYEDRPQNCRQYPYQINYDTFTLTNTDYCLIAKDHLAKNIVREEALKISKRDGLFQSLEIPTWWSRKIQRKYMKKYGHRTTSTVVMAFTIKGQQMIDFFNKN